MGAGFFGECGDAAVGIDVDSSVAGSVVDMDDRDGDHGVLVVAMEGKQIAEVNFEERVAVQDEEVGSVLQMRLSES